MKRLAITAVAGAVTVSASGCSSVSSGKRAIHVSHAQSETHPEHLGVLVSREYVEEHLGDKYEVQILPNEILGSVQKTIELTQTGTINLVIAGTADLETFADIYEIFSMPYLSDSEEVYRPMMEDTDYTESIYRSTDEAGFRVVTWYSAGTRNLYVKTPISTPDDLKDRKIRVQQSPASVDMVNAFGAAAAPMGFGRVYTAIQQGVISGVENNELVLTNNKHGEVAKYYTYNKHQMVPGVLVANLKFLNGLDPEELIVFKEAAALSTEMELVERDKNIEETRQIVANDMDVTFIGTDVETSKVKVLPLHQKMLENNLKIRDLYEYIQIVNDSMKGGAQIMDTMHKVRATIMKILGVVITLLFILITLVGTYQIVTRYFFNRPSTISEELLTYSFTWMSLLASAYVFGKRGHMRMGSMADKLTGPARRYPEIFIDTLSFFFATVVMVYGGISITRLTMIQIAASLRISMGWIYVIVPITGLLVMVFSVMNTVDVLHKDFSEPGGAKIWV